MVQKKKSGLEKARKRLMRLAFRQTHLYRFVNMVGVAGLEPAASWSRTKHTTKLCHTPIAILLYKMAERLSRCGGNFCDFFKKKRSRLNRPLRFSHCYRIFGGRLIPAKSPRKAAHIRKQTIHPAFLYSCICVPP